MDSHHRNKQRTIRLDSPWQVAQALLTLGLMLCGLIGIAIHLFGSDLAPGGAYAWIQASPLHIILVLMIAIAALLFHRYITHISNQQRRFATNLPLYLLMLLGVYFIYRLLTTGQW